MFAMHVTDRRTALSTCEEIPHVSKTTTNNSIEQWSPKCGPWALGVLTTSSLGPAVETLSTFTLRCRLSVLCADVCESRGG